MEARVVFVPCGGMHAGAVHEARRPGKWAEVEAAEAFRVDDLLDFSNDEIAGPIGGDEFQVSDQSADSCVTVAEEQAGHNSTSEKQKDQIPNALEAEDLCVACDDIAELEWLSTFVEDSFSADKFLKPALASALLGGSTPKHTPSLPVPGRARSKRSRASVRVWSSRLLSSNSCRSLESASHQSFYSFGSPETGFLSPDEWGDEFLHVAKKPNKILRRKTWQDAAVPRRCSHCLTQRTPQWRAGPLGAKTLCNACGVRFKSGRLLPEYRPAGSPTFVSHQHSNSHRKVLEMRKQKTQPQVEEVEVSTRDQTPQKSSSEELNTQ